MQNPVGYTLNPTTHRAELTDFVAVLTNVLTTITFVHTIVAAFLTAGAFMAGVASGGSSAALARTRRRSGSRAGSGR